VRLLVLLIYVICIFNGHVCDSQSVIIIIIASKNILVVLHIYTQVYKLLLLVSKWWCKLYLVWFRHFVSIIGYIENDTRKTNSQTTRNTWEIHIWTWQAHLAFLFVLTNVTNTRNCTGAVLSSFFEGQLCSYVWLEPIFCAWAIISEKSHKNMCRKGKAANIGNLVSCEVGF